MSSMQRQHTHSTVPAQPLSREPTSAAAADGVVVDALTLRRLTGRKALTDHTYDAYEQIKVNARYNGTIASATWGTVNRTRRSIRAG